MTVEIWQKKAIRTVASAQLLLADGDYDGACSCAYYAMFYSARACLLHVGQPAFAMAKTHSGLRSAFNLHLIKGGKIDAELGRVFSREEKRRLIADYEGDGLSIDEAVEAIGNAQNFVAIVGKLISFPAEDG